LKNEQALEDYLISSIKADLSIEYGDGKKQSGDEFTGIIFEAVKSNALCGQIARRFNADIAQTLGCFDMLNHKLFDPSNLENIRNIIKAKLPNLDPDKTDWAVNLDDDVIEFSRLVRGIKNSCSLSLAHVESVEFTQLANTLAKLGNIFHATAKLYIKGNMHEVTSPSQMVSIILDYSKKGLAIQRFKGLGEMNSEQLWETTLDPTTRTLLRVKINDFDEAEEVFSTLMSSVVEPRRDFIQANALNVRNLDV
jgi:DNA gyrase subunit B